MDTREQILEVIEGIKHFQDHHIKQLNELRAEVEALAGANALGGGRPATAPNLSADERKAVQSAAIALLQGDGSAAYQHFTEVKMEAGIDAAGGYLVIPHYSETMTRVIKEISPLSRLARTVDLRQGDSFEEIIDKEEAAASWVGETAARNDTAAPDLAKFTCALHELCAQPKVSQKLIDTASIDVMAWLTDKLGESFGATESAAFHTGNGIGKPRGFLDYPVASTGDATRAWGTLQYVATGASGAFATPSASVNSADVLVDVVGALKAQYRNGAAWLMNRSTAAAVRKLKDADGRHVWVDSLIQGQPSVLLGYPVEVSEDMPAIGANSLSIAFGNFQKGYTVIRKGGVKFMPDPFTAKPFVRLFTYARVGGGLNNSEAIKLVKFGTS